MGSHPNIPVPSHFISIRRKRTSDPLSVSLSSQAGTAPPSQGERTLHDWMRFLAKECATSTKGKDLLKLQFAAYAEKHELPRRLRAVLAHMIMLLQGRRSAAGSGVDRVVPPPRLP